MRQLTKILATVGPACEDETVLERMIDAGVTAFRVNFSHGDYESKADQIARIRSVESRRKVPIGILADLSGPKIRVGEVENGSIELVDGAELIVQAESCLGTPARVCCSLPELLRDVRTGEKVLLDDGRLHLTVLHDTDSQIVCRVDVGGTLKSRKGLNLPDSDLSLSALTKKDRRDVEWIASQDFDWIALSFVQRAEDVEDLRLLTYGHDLRIPLVAKIEKPLAVQRIESIAAAADAIMVARGDLAVEMDFPLVPIAQKRIAKICTRKSKPCIIATEMLESMVHSKTPTRAEVSDVANAVLDGADAVMLSAETAVGEHPIDTVRMMSRTITATLTAPDLVPPVTADLFGELQIAKAVKQMIGVHEIAVAAVFVQSGETVKALAKIQLPCPILAITPTTEMRRRMSLYRGVYAVDCRREPSDLGDLLRLADEAAIECGLARSGEKLMLVSNTSAHVPWAVEGLVIHTLE